MPDWSLGEAIQAIQTCQHQQTRPTRATKSNGVVCVYVQCVKCGEKVKEVSKRDFNVDILPAFNDELRRRHREKKEQDRKQVVERWQFEREQEQEAKESEFWRKYSAYLRSAHWKRLRLNVLRRDDYRCQNCFDPVTESTAHVHHMSYVGFQRLGYSFAFECVTLCRECHEAFHGGLEQH